MSKLFDLLALVTLEADVGGRVVGVWKLSRGARQIFVGLKVSHGGKGCNLLDWVFDHVVVHAIAVHCNDGAGNKTTEEEKQAHVFQKLEIKNCSFTKILDI